MTTATRRAHARRSDPETSRQAAASVRELWPSEQAVLTVLTEGDATDEEILARIRRVALIEGYENWAPSRIRHARKVLVDLGRVRRATDMSGKEKVGKTDRGGACAVWVLDGEGNR